MDLSKNENSNKVTSARRFVKARASMMDMQAALSREDESCRGGGGGVTPGGSTAAAAALRGVS